MESLYPIQKKASKEKITFKVNDQIEDNVEVPGEDNQPVYEQNGTNKSACSNLYKVS